MWPYISNNQSGKTGVYTIENPFSNSIQDLNKFSSKERISELVSEIVVIAKSNERIKARSEIKIIEPLDKITNNKLDKNIYNISNKNSKNTIDNKFTNNKYLSSNQRSLNNYAKIKEEQKSINHINKLNSTQSNLSTQRTNNKRKLETEYNVLSKVYQNKDNLSNWKSTNNYFKSNKEKSFESKQDNSKYSSTFFDSKFDQKYKLSKMPSFKINRNNTTNQNNLVTLTNNQFSKDRDYRNLSSSNSINKDEKVASIKYFDIRTQNNSNTFSTKIIDSRSKSYERSSTRTDHSATYSSPVVYTGQQTQLISNNLDPRLNKKQSQINTNDPRANRREFLSDKELPNISSTTQSSIYKAISDNNQIREEIRKEMKKKEEELKKKQAEKIMQDELRRREELKRKEETKRKEAETRRKEEETKRKEEETKRKEEEARKKEETRNELNFYDELINAQPSHGPKVLPISAYLKLERERELKESSIDTSNDRSNDNSQFNGIKKLKLESLSIDRNSKSTNSNNTLPNSLLNNQPSELNLNLNEIIEQDLDLDGNNNLNEEVDEGQQIINFLNAIKK